MQWLNLSYGAWFNRRQRRSGSLFQGRFKAILHEPESRALPINRYIHLNPVRLKALGGHETRSSAEDQLGAAGTGPGPSRELVEARVTALSNYRWSSYQVYVGKTRTPGWLTTESIYRFFGDHTLHSLRGDCHRPSCPRWIGLFSKRICVFQPFQNFRRRILRHGRKYEDLRFVILTSPTIKNKVLIASQHLEYVSGQLNHKDRLS
jgi:hypothetical protein